MHTIPQLGFGLSLRNQHWNDVLTEQPKDVQWFEIISENFMHDHGYPREVLAKVRASYPVAMHGVSLSIGSSDPINKTYLKSLKALADWLQPAWISDHICWTGVNDINTHDLLPVPYTEDALTHMVSKVHQVQNYLGQRILLENPSNYLAFSENTMTEWDFIIQLLEQADCLLLLDINNIYVTCFNHKLNPQTYIDAIPAHRIGQVHLAGHEYHGTHIIDTHDRQVSQDVLALYAYTMRTKGQKNTMIEWDNNIPDLATLRAELDRVRQFNEESALVDFSGDHTQPNTANATPFDALMGQFQSCVLKNQEPGAWAHHREDFAANKQLNVYQYAYRKRLYDAIVDTYPQTCAAMGSDGFSLLVRTFIEHTPSTFYAMEDYIEGFSPYLKVQSPEHAAVINAETAHGALRKQPQLPPTQLDALVDAGPEGFLSMNLKFLPTVMLISDPPQLLVCEELQVYRQELSLLEHQILGTINATNSLGETLEYLYQNDICTADDVLTTLQTILTDFVPKGLFQLVPGNAAATLREQAIQVRRRIQTVPSVSAKN